jgi:hypothetical protein
MESMNGRIGASLLALELSLTLTLTLTLAVSRASLGSAQHAMHGEDRTPAPAREPADVLGPVPPYSAFPTPAFDSRGRLWLAFVEATHVYVTASDDLGKTFRRAVAVNPEPEPIDANGEGRPKIAFARDGAVLVTWTRKMDEPYTGLIRFSRSTDGGTSFSVPKTLNDDGLATGHRFDALAVAPSGEVLVAWIDKRDLVRAQSRGEPYSGAAVYLATSADSGRRFGPNRKIEDNVCECCRLSFAFDSRGEASLLFRGVLEGGIRDHVLVQSVDEPEKMRVQRVTFDQWKIDACPHHGPSLWIDSADRYHVAWFTAGERSGTGVFYARSTDAGNTFSRPMAVGGELATHPFVLGSGNDIYLAWMEGDGAKSVVRLEVSGDGGERWSPPLTLAEGAPGADHPILVKRGEDVYLSWFTRVEGYRLMALPRGGAISRVLKTHPHPAREASSPARREARSDEPRGWGHGMETDGGTGCYR